jgi:hypothetical protein
MYVVMIFGNFARTLLNEGYLDRYDSAGERWVVI